MTPQESIKKRREEIIDGYYNQVGGSGAFDIFRRVVVKQAVNHSPFRNSLAADNVWIQTEIDNIKAWAKSR